MRRIRAVVAATVLLVATFAVGSPSGANTTDTDAGGTDGGIYAGAAKPGSRSGSVPNVVGCGWDPVWGGDSPLETLVRRLTEIFSGEDLPDDATIEVVPGGGGDRDDIFEPLLGEIVGRSGDGIVIGTYEGRNVTLANVIVFYLLGSQPLGEFIDNPIVDSFAAELELRDRIREGTATPILGDGDEEPEEPEPPVFPDNFRNNGAYPRIQRGEHWWDPYYISLENHGLNAAGNPDPSCASQLIYVPRDSDPRAFIPDLQALFVDLLPPVEPVLQPLDRNNDWAYVQVPTDFSATAASLDQPVAHAEIPDILNGGTIWIEATAVPTYYVFNPGDGRLPVICDVTDATYDPEVPSDCSYTYLDASSVEGGTFTASLTIYWRGEYESSDGPGVFAVSPTRTVFPVEVAEARAVGTRPE